MPFDVIEIRRREDEREQALEQKFKLQRDIIPVILCNAQGEYEGADGLPLSAQVEGDPVRVWARTFGESPPGQFLNIRGVPAYTGIPAYAGYLDDSQEMEILSVNVAEYTELVRELKERHALQHQPGGFDPLDVLLEMLVPLKITVGSGLNISIAPLGYEYGGAYVWFGGQNNFSLTASIPAAGLARYTLVYLDPADNTIKVVDGATGPDAKSFVPDQPAPPDDTYPAGWIRLAGGQTQLNQVSDVKEARLLLDRFAPAGDKLNNYTATTDPGVGDDSDDGYSVGSIWINVTADTAWICVDAAVGAAVWKQIDAAAGGGGAQNIAINGNFQSWPEQTSFTAATTIVNNDKIYFADQWVYLAEQNDVADITRQNFNAAGAQYYAKFEIETANTQFAIMQPFTNAKSLALRQETVSLFFRGLTALGNEIENIRAAIIGWSGTPDALTDPISTWIGEGTNPTLAANWAYISNPSNLALVANDWVDYKIENVALGSSFSNLAILIWIDDEDAAVDDVLGITTVLLVKGATAPDVYPHEDTEQTLDDCRKYFLALSSVAPILGFKGTLALVGFRDFGIFMRAAPTFSHNITGWTAGSPGTTTVAAFNYNAAAWTTITGSLTTTAQTSKDSFTLRHTPGTSFSGSAADTLEFYFGPDVKLFFNSRLAIS